jgi:hypothetical protein
VVGCQRSGQVNKGGVECIVALLVSHACLGIEQQPQPGGKCNVSVVWVKRKCFLKYEYKYL